jgi:4-hydroxyphenylpyruvate dioxygenase-like putative hemolysin
MIPELDKSSYEDMMSSSNHDVVMIGYIDSANSAISFAKTEFILYPMLLSQSMIIFSFDHLMNGQKTYRLSNQTRFYTSTFGVEAGHHYEHDQEALDCYNKTIMFVEDTAKKSIETFTNGTFSYATVEDSMRYVESINRKNPQLV